MKIAVDLDEVLANFNKGFLDYHNKKYNTSFGLVSDRPYMYDEFLGISIEEAIERVLHFYGSPGFIRLEPVDLSQDFVRKLVKKNDLLILTSRPSSTRDLTVDWVTKHYGDIFKEIVFTGQFGLPDKNKEITKSIVCKGKGVDIFIDDAIHYVEEVAKEGIESFLFDRPWNQNYNPPKNVKRVYDWKEIVKVVESM